MNIARFLLSGLVGGSVFQIFNILKVVTQN